jgi:hypothetical protein
MVNMHLPHPIVKMVDDSGRLTIGREFAGKNCTIQRTEDGTLIITPVCVVPEREMWILQNPEVLKKLDEALKTKSAPFSLDELEDL